jgi:hypothetical protein
LRRSSSRKGFFRLQEVELGVDEPEGVEPEEDEFEGGAAAGVESAAGVEFSVFAAGAFASAGADSDAASLLPDSLLLGA